MSDCLTSVLAIGRGDHVGIRYAGDGERRELWAAHVVAAAERGERVVFIDAGARCGRPAAPSVEGGQVTVLTADEAGFAGGRLDARRLADVLHGQADDAARLGLRGLRLCVELADVLPVAPGVPDPPHAHDRAGARCPLTALPALLPRPAAIVCHGDRVRLPGARLRALEGWHALTLDTGPSLTRSPLLRVVPVRGPSGLRLIGEIDASNVGVLARALEEAPLDGRDLRLDVSRLRHADVAAVRLLVRVAEAMPDGHRLVLHSPGPVVRAVLRYYGWAARLVLEEGDWG